MQFHFQLPYYVIGTGVILAEAEMMAELCGDPRDPEIEALYVFELGTGKRFEVHKDRPEFRKAALYLRSNPQEQARIECDWPADETPRRAVVHEHSTYVGRP